MYDVAILKRSNLLLEQVIAVLENKLPIKKATCYQPAQHRLFYETEQLPDVMIIDIDPHLEDEIFEFVKYCTEKDLKTVAWLSHEICKERLLQLFKQSLDGYFYSEMETNDLIFAFEGILNDRQYIHPYLSSVLLDDYVRLTCEEPKRPSGLLTEREWEVLELIVEGKKTGHISEKLYISTRTVTNHIASILRKLKVNSRTHAALLAVKKRWIIL